MQVHGDVDKNFQQKVPMINILLHLCKLAYAYALVQTNLMRIYCK